MRSTPASVSFCTTHSGRSPFTGTKPRSPRARARRRRHDRPVGFEDIGDRTPPQAVAGPGEPARRASAPARRRHHRLARAQAQHLGEVVLVVGRHGERPSRSATKTWATAPAVPATAVGARPGARRGVTGAHGAPDQPNAERRRDMRPSSGGPTSSPLSAANWRSRSSCVLRELAWACPPPRGRRGRPGRGPRTWGTPRPRSLIRCPVWVPAGTASDLGRRRASRTPGWRPAPPGRSTRAARRGCRRRRGRRRRRDCTARCT